MAQKSGFVGKPPVCTKGFIGGGKKGGKGRAIHGKVGGPRRNFMPRFAFGKGFGFGPKFPT